MPMATGDRAAQFASFSALTGYDDAIKETARITRKKPRLSSDGLEELNIRFQILIATLDRKNTVDITYFVPDSHKPGGKVMMIQGIVEKIDTVQRIITLSDGVKIPMNDVVSVEGEILGFFDV